MSSSTIFTFLNNPVLFSFDANRAALDAQSKPEEETMVVNLFATIDKADVALQHRPRFSPRVRFEP